MRPSSKYLGSSAGSILRRLLHLRARAGALPLRRSRDGVAEHASSSERSVSAVGDEVVSVCTDADAGSLQNDLGQLLVQAERWGDAEADLRIPARHLGDHAGMSDVECLPGESM